MKRKLQTKVCAARKCVIEPVFLVCMTHEILRLYATKGALAADESAHQTTRLGGGPIPQN